MTYKEYITIIKSIHSQRISLFTSEIKKSKTYYRLFIFPSSANNNTDESKLLEEVDKYELRYLYAISETVDSSEYENNIENLENALTKITNAVNAINWKD